MIFAADNIHPLHPEVAAAMDRLDPEPSGSAPVAWLMRARNGSMSTRVISPQPAPTA